MGLGRFVCWAWVGYATVCRFDGALDMVCALRVRTVLCLPFPPSHACGQQWRSPRMDWITCVVLMSTVRGGTAPPRPAWAIPSCTALQHTRVDKFVDMCASHAPVASGIAALLCESRFFPASPSSRGTVLPRLRTAQVVRCVGSLSVPSFGFDLLRLAASARPVDMWTMMWCMSGEYGLHKLFANPSPDVDALICELPSLRITTMINLRDLQGRTLLHLACIHRSSTTMAKVLTWGADVNAQDHAGMTPLHVLLRESVDEGKQASASRSAACLLACLPACLPASTCPMFCSFVKVCEPLQPPAGPHPHHHHYVAPHFCGMHCYTGQPGGAASKGTDIALPPRVCVRNAPAALSSTLPWSTLPTSPCTAVELLSVRVVCPLCGLLLVCCWVTAAVEPAV